ncbi:uncharacterized protein B0H64DRAFT_470724 [Chaetomium fimeti]|uniref:Uncharacterized protein n=1 Tax=Chaetomium fimeti TaxID=1854472 RepID=A0AAE0HQ58_9PEZI|nr:hypothetical protein B0H64DRAFT_470724 [Chaetomium fimeti]
MGMAEMGLSRETLAPLGPELSSTPSKVSHSSSLGPSYISSPLRSTTLLDKIHKQQQSNSGSFQAVDPNNSTPHPETLLGRFLLAVKSVLSSRIVNVLLVFVPMGITVHMARMPVGIILVMDVISIVPLASLLLFDIETVADRLDDTAGAWMNIAFGHAVELIILIIALGIEHICIGRLSLVVSVLANFLLVLRMCYSRLRFGEQLYNRMATQMNACLLAVTMTNLLLPSAFHVLFSINAAADGRVAGINRGTSIIVLVVYFGNLIEGIEALQRLGRDLQQRGRQEPPQKPPLPFLPDHLTTLAARPSNQNSPSTAPGGSGPSVRRAQSEPSNRQNNHDTQGPTRRLIISNPESDNPQRLRPVAIHQQHLVSYASVTLFLLMPTVMLVFNAWSMLSWVDRTVLLSTASGSTLQLMDKAIGVAASDVLPILLLSSPAVILVLPRSCLKCLVMEGRGTYRQRIMFYALSVGTIVVTVSLEPYLKAVKVNELGEGR